MKINWLKVPSRAWGLEQGGEARPRARASTPRSAALRACGQRRPACGRSAAPTAIFSGRLPRDRAPRDGHRPRGLPTTIRISSSLPERPQRPRAAKFWRFRDWLMSLASASADDPRIQIACRNRKHDDLHQSDQQTPADARRHLGDIAWPCFRDMGRGPPQRRSLPNCLPSRPSRSPPGWRDQSYIGWLGGRRRRRRSLRVRGCTSRPQLPRISHDGAAVVTVPLPLVVNVYN